MVIVELPDEKEGWAGIVIDNRYIGGFWVNGNIEVHLVPDGWLIILFNEGASNNFIYADAIRKK